MNPCKKTSKIIDHTLHPNRKNTTHNHKTNNPQQSNKKSKKPLSKKNEKTCSDVYIIDQRHKSKIPRLLNQLERNVQQLKKYCIHIVDNTSKTKKSLATIRSQTKIGIQHNKTGVSQQIQDIRKSYASTYGKDTSNLVQLYNFYKKGIEKSTGILGSISKKAQSMSMSRNKNELLSREQSISKSKTPSIITQNHQNQYQSYKLSSKKKQYQGNIPQRQLNNIFIKGQSERQSENCRLNNQNNQNFDNIPEKQVRKCAQFINIARIFTDKRKSLQEKPRVINYRDFHNSHNEIFNSKSHKKQHLNIETRQIRQNFQEIKAWDQPQTNAKQLRSDKRKNIIQKFTFINSPFNSHLDRNGHTPEKIIEIKEEVQGGKDSKTEKNKYKQSHSKSSKKNSNKSQDSQEKSSKKCELLNQGQFFQEFDRKESKDTQTNVQKKFENSKYYVQPIKKFTDDAENSLFDCSISFRDDELNCRNVNLDFIPLDL